MQLLSHLLQTLLHPGCFHGASSRLFLRLGKLENAEVGILENSTGKNHGKKNKVFEIRQPWVLSGSYEVGGIESLEAGKLSFGVFSYLWLVGNGGMEYNYNYYYFHSSIPY